MFRFLRPVLAAAIAMSGFACVGDDGELDVPADAVPADTGDVASTAPEDAEFRATCWLRQTMRTSCSDGADPTLTVVDQCVTAGPDCSLALPSDYEMTEGDCVTAYEHAVIGEVDAIDGETGCKEFERYVDGDLPAECLLTAHCGPGAECVEHVCECATQDCPERIAAVEIENDAEPATASDFVPIGPFEPPIPRTPGPPRLVSPANGYVIRAVSGVPTQFFTWDRPSSGPLATSYLFWMEDADDPNGFRTPNVTIQSSRARTTTSQILPPVLAGARIRWNVRACFGSSFLLCGGTSSRVLEWSITPPPPRLRAPGDNATVQPTGQAYTWTSSRGASSYLFCASRPGVSCPPNEIDNGNTLVIRRLGNSNTVALPDLSRFVNQPVNWTVAACNGSGDCAYQQQFRRLNVRRIQPPQLRSPAAFATVEPTGQTYTWTSVPGATSYLFCASRPGVACPSTPVSNSNTLVIRRLSNGTTFAIPDLTRFLNQPVNWTVAACSSSGDCAYQQQFRQLNVRRPPPPAAPRLSAPANGATVAPTGVAYRWFAVAGASHYLLCATANGATCPTQPTSNATTEVVRVTSPGAQPDLTRFLGNTVEWTAAACDSRGQCTYQQSRRRVTLRTPPPPPPFINLSLSTRSVDVVWGAQATVTVTVEGRNNFSGPVALSVTNPQYGMVFSFSPATVNLAANGTATSTLTVSTTTGGTVLDPRDVTVRAAPQGAGAKTQRFSVEVLRTPGNFSAFGLTSSSTQCGGVSANVTNRRVVFDGPLFSRTPAIDLQPGRGYDVSPNCRAAITISPGIRSNPNSVNVWNLGFTREVGNDSPGNVIGSSLTSPYVKGWFSPDDSLAVVVVGTQNVSSAILYDVAKGYAIGTKPGLTSNITGVTIAGDTVTLVATPPISNRTWRVR